MLRAQKALLQILICIALLTVTIAVPVPVPVPVPGPFSGAEQALGLTDREAHIIALFALTLRLQLAFPRVRRTDLALWVLVLGALIEVAQLFTGRRASVGDQLADLIGVSVATLPSYAETFRHYLQLGHRAPRRRPQDAAKRSKASQS